MSNQVPNYSAIPPAPAHAPPAYLGNDNIIRVALNILEKRLQREVEITVSCPDDVKKFLVLKLAEWEREVFSVMFLDNRHQLIKYEELFMGTIDGATVYPREVVKRSLELNAAAVIIAHNHPSNIAEPSSDDKKITLRLKDALEFTVNN